MKISYLLQIARQRLLDYGWRQGHAGTSDGPVCAIGAVYHSFPGLQHVHERNNVYNVLNVVINCYKPGIHQARGCYYVGDWNDVPSRTKEEVLQAYDDAISLAMSEESLENV